MLRAGPGCLHHVNVHICCVREINDLSLQTALKENVQRRESCFTQFHTISHNSDPQTRCMKRTALEDESVAKLFHATTRKCRAPHRDQAWVSTTCVCVCSIQTRNHRMIPLHPPPLGIVMCEFCGNERATWTCAECIPERLCSDCDDIRHRNKVHHLCHLSLGLQPGMDIIILIYFGGGRGWGGLRGA